MDRVDGIVLGLVAMADLTLLAYLRRRRARALRLERMWRSLTLAIRKETAAPLNDIRTRWGRRLTI